MTRYRHRRQTNGTIRDTNCPACGQPVLRTHHCPGAPAAHRLDRPAFNQLLAHARAEARADQAEQDQMQLPLEEDQ